MERDSVCGCEQYGLPRVGSRAHNPEVHGGVGAAPKVRSIVDGEHGGWARWGAGGGRGADQVVSWPWVVWDYPCELQ